MKKRGLILGWSAAVLTACGGNSAPETYPTVAFSTNTEAPSRAVPSSAAAKACGRLSLPEFILGKPPLSGEGVLARNQGECAEVHDENTLQTLGSIAAGGQFDILCKTGPKPTGFRIEMGFGDKGLQGEVLLDEAAAAILNNDQLSISVPDCA
ncbi:MAG TPA: hypothetical protein VF733_03095 [Candidatus Saccharimonadales bacterium]